jgi:hypothetical protein
MMSKEVSSKFSLKNRFKIVMISTQVAGVSCAPFENERVLAIVMKPK